MTKRPPAELLEIERAHLHEVPDAPFSAPFSESRTVGWSATVSCGGARYSVPDSLCDTQVCFRAAAGEVIIVAGSGSGAREVARQRLCGPGRASISDAHYRHRPANPPRLHWSIGSCTTPTSW